MPHLPIALGAELAGVGLCHFWAVAPQLLANLVGVAGGFRGASLCHRAMRVSAQCTGLIRSPPERGNIVSLVTFN